MSNIGALGSIPFIVTVDLIRTFDKLTRTSSGRWAKHEVLGSKSLTQRVGPGLDTISFTVSFDWAYGLDPRKELDALIVLERTGRAVPLVIGSKPLGVGLWVITSLEQSWSEVDNKGRLIRAAANISLEEYVAVVKR